VKRPRIIEDLRSASFIRGNYGCNAIPFTGNDMVGALMVSLEVGESLSPEMVQRSESAAQ
jgi:hypothetical protein